MDHRHNTRSYLDVLKEDCVWTETMLAKPKAIFPVLFSLLLARPSGNLMSGLDEGDVMHLYMTTLIESMGLKEALGRVGAHLPGVDPLLWRERVADDAAIAVERGFITLALGHDMVFVADLLVAEMHRHPQIVAWAPDIYADAAYHGYDPMTAETDIAGQYVRSPADAFIDAFLESLISEEPAHA